MKKGSVYVVANWKMHPESLEEAEDLFLDLKEQIIKMKLSVAKVVICPPAIFLAELRELYSGTKLALGVQDVHAVAEGSFTGQISAQMAKSTGADYAIVGHSEKRAYGDTNEIVNQKVQVALKEKMNVILCIGEEERDRQGEYLAFLQDELTQALKDVPQKELKNIMVAYEPIWAIGKTEDEAMKPTDVHQTVLFLRKILAELYDRRVALSLPILYGGSVEVGNANELLTEGEVNGFLVGHASLVPSEFVTIVDIAERAKK